MLWRENETKWGKKLFWPCGSLRLRKDDSYAKTGVPPLRDAGLKVDELTPAEAAKRFPQINMENVGWALYEHDAGYLLARRACQAVHQAFLAEGGTYRQLAVKPTDLEESGHGFKHGPAFGERVAETVLGERKKDETFSLSRFEIGAGAW